MYQSLHKKEAAQVSLRLIFRLNSNLFSLILSFINVNTLQDVPIAFCHYQYQFFCTVILQKAFLSKYDIKNQYKMKKTER